MDVKRRGPPFARNDVRSACAIPISLVSQRHKRIDARRAHRRHGAREHATIAITPETAANVTQSSGATPYNRPDNNRAAPTAPAMPMTPPMAVSVAPSIATRRTT